MTASAPRPATPADDRAAQAAAFLVAAGWGEAARAPLAGDASTRRYERLRRSGETAVLMDAPPGAEAAACPPDADAAERARLGYNAQARLAGPNATAFTGLARELWSRGFSAPEILAADPAAGFVLLEDLGDGLFARVIAEGQDPAPLYEAAIDVLAAVGRSTFPDQVSDGAWPLLAYDPVALQAEADLFVEWYMPRRAEADVDAGALDEWRAIWTEAFAALTDTPPTLVLRDVHAENLIWRPEREGPARVGLLDFQDALMGHPAYDLASLLEDARRDVEPGLAAAMKDRYRDAAGIADAARFDAAYAVLAAQRNVKILGVFARLAFRDAKPAYLDFLPRVARHVVRDLEHPALADLARWTARHAPAVAEEARR